MWEKVINVWITVNLFKKQLVMILHKCGSSNGTSSNCSCSCCGNCNYYSGSGSNSVVILVVVY